MHSFWKRKGEDEGGVVWGASWRAAGSGVSKQSRREVESGCGRASGGPPFKKGADSLPLPETEKSDAARASPHRSHGTPPARHRSLGHRVVARSRVGGDDADVSPCRPAVKAGSSFQNDTNRCEVGILQAGRHAAGLPGVPLIMPPATMTNPRDSPIPTAPRT